MAGQGESWGKIIKCTKTGKSIDIEECLDCDKKCERILDNTDDSHMLIDREYFLNNKKSGYYIRGKIGNELDDFREYEAISVFEIQEGYRLRLPINMKGEMTGVCVVDGDLPIDNIIKDKACNLLECILEQFSR